MPPESRLDIEIAPLQPGDYDAVRAIYLEGIATGNATFEKSAPEWHKWDRDHLPSCRLSPCSASATSPPST
jgi:phosphinothricin acetyltransferase